MKNFYIAPIIKNSGKVILVNMPGDRCIVCRIHGRMTCWLLFIVFEKNGFSEFGLVINRIKRFTYVCSRHFRNGDISNGPNKQLGVSHKLCLVVLASCR